MSSQEGLVWSQASTKSVITQTHIGPCQSWLQTFPIRSLPLHLCHLKISHDCACLCRWHYCHTSAHNDKVTALISSLTSHFAPKTKGLHLSKLTYIHGLLIRSKMDGAKPSATPISPGNNLSKTKVTPMSDSHFYRNIVSSLQHATITRSNISYAVNKTFQFMHYPTLEHWNVVKQTWWYLKGTITHGIQLNAHSSLELHAYNTDSDW